MNRNRSMVSVVCVALLLSAALNSNVGMRLLHSEREYANVMATSIYEAMKLPNIEIERGVQRLHASNPVELAGRTMVVEAQTLGDLGWPTVVTGATVVFVRDDGSKSKVYTYSFLRA